MRNKSQLDRRRLMGTAALALLATAAALVARYRADAGQAHQAHQVPRSPAAPKKMGSSAGTPGASIQTHRNIGKAYYEQGKYPEAIAELEKAIALGHASSSGRGRALATDHLNLGMALMQANQLDQALGELTTAQQMDPKLVAAEYNLGIVFKRELRYPDAEAAMKRVVASDPGDPATWFNLGEVYFSEKKLPQSLDAHQRVLQMGFGRGQNFYVASLFHVFTILIRLGKPDEAQKYLKLHQQFKDKVPGISVQSPALEAGKYGAIIVPPAPPQLAVHAPPEPATFEEIDSKLGLPAIRAVTGEAPRLRRSSGEHLERVYTKLAEVLGGSIAVAAYDGDGHPDVYVVDAMGPNRLYRNSGAGRFKLVDAKAGVSGSPGAVSATFADYDNSGHPSLFVAGLGGITLYHNNGDGTFTNVTAKAGLTGKPGELATRTVAFDSDNDGFLDLLVTVYTEDLLTPLENRDVDQFTFPGDLGDGKALLYRNNGDGTFTDITASSGLASAKGHMLGAVFSDFNNDGYMDLLLFRHGQSPLLYINQGEDKFVDRTAAAGADLAASQAFDGQAADLNHDGNFDLVLSSWSGYQVLLNRGGGRFESVSSIRRTHAALGPGYRATVADVDGDGFDDLLVPHPAGAWYLLANRGGQFQKALLRFSLEAEPANAAVHLPRSITVLTAARLTDPGRLDLVGALDGQPVVFEKTGPPARWSEVKLDGYKSNKEGVGAVVEFKAGEFYKKVMATGGPVRVFTGDVTRLDVVRVTWPNLVVQNSINVPTNQTITVRESERLASSCPFLYVWNGHEFRFLTDIMGVAPIGELAPDGTRIKPNPDQLVRLGSLPEPNNMMTFQVTDEMRETDYFDRLRLLAVDHAASEEVYGNEIYSSTPPPLELYAVRDKRFPKSAVDDHGTDVLPLLREVDGRYPTAFRRNRILGLADTHSLTLDLGEFLPASRTALYLTGWVFWTDSNASRALASNSEMEMISPYVEARDGAGKWVKVIPDMGLPAGTNRTMRVDLTGKFPSRDHHVRIVTNFCVYWDQIFFTTDDRVIPLPGVAAPAPATVSPQAGLVAPAQSVFELPLVSAGLHYRGFSAPTTDPQHVKPDWFDYAHLMSEAPWNPFLGDYTRYGAVDDLLRHDDDRLVVMATGDEMTVRFSGSGLPPLQPGWKRDFFLYARGYAKDGEPNTADFRTAEPLPFYGMGNYPYDSKRYPGGKQQEEYLRNYETRPGHLLIPPLAPRTAGSMVR